MAYDLARGRVVLFGGLGAGYRLFADTWEWDGQKWSQRSPKNSPSPRYSHAMAYDVARQRVVLFGGWDVNSVVTHDTWEWDGKNWNQRSTKNSPSARQFLAMAYDVVRQRSLLFSGSDELADTWHFGHPASIESFGLTCAGNSSSPSLTSDTPYLGHSAFGLDLSGARDSSPCAFGLSARRQDRPIPPCTLYLQSPIVPLLAVTNAAGLAKSQRVTIPFNNNLRGLTLYAQAFVADPQGPVSGLTFSGGLKLVVGD